MNKHRPSGQSGSVFFYIILGITLFAALGFTVSRSMRGGNTSMLTERRAELASSDVLTYAQQLATAVDTLRRQNCAETDVSFERAPFDGSDALYVNTNDRDGYACHVFHPHGGDFTFKNMQADIFDTNRADQDLFGDVVFTGHVGFKDVGTDENAELMLLIPYITPRLCQQITTDLSQEPMTVDAFTAIPFNGDFKRTTFMPEIIGRDSGCFTVTGNTAKEYAVFYKVLIAR